MDRKRALKIGVPAAAVLAGVGALALWLGGGRGKASTPTYETAAATRGDVSEVVTASGTLSPLVTVQVGSQVSGRVQALHADFNSRVKKGQVIARIDPSLFESQVAQARANEAVAVASVRSTEAALAEARRQHERTVSLAAKTLVAQADADATLAKLEAAEAEQSAAKARVAQAKAARQQAETNLAYTVIPSPIDGIVISRDASVGQTVAASLQAPTLFTLAEDLSKMEVHTDVAESDVGRISAGMEVEFSVDAFPADRFRGVVKEVRYAPKTVQNVVTYDAVVAVENPELKLRPGMTADVRFVVASAEDALLVPNGALRFRPANAADPAAAGEAAGSAEGGGAAATGSPSPARGGEGRGAGAGTTAAPSSGETRTGEPRSGAARVRGEGGRRGRRVVWVLGDGGALRAVPVQAGPSDGKSTAVLAGELAEGDRVVVGVAGAPASPAAASPQGGGQRRNSFRPPFP